ncbi:Leucine-rich repeat receptor-like protein kinase PXC1 [Striga hermonthica]|uniref:Leucine-rich repeat receptor-like protein kinase PXC1 n=1 Tax=Striga hermonthica TaxID=68872 RepID=A0A9N7NFD6_STRHE|nr:Leucine-rich repeat receptor-like protein kinase PXC1 [Striga hermonthica]
MELHFPSLLLSAATLLLALSISSAANDTAALSLFRSQTDPHGALLPNWTTTPAAPTACAAAWSGVRCSRGRVTAVVLHSLSLRGSISALSSIDQLRLLDLRNNRLTGDLSPLTKCTNLKLAYLSGNDFSGQIPPDLPSLRRLLRLDLSNNNLRGPIPQNLSALSRLLTLNLQDNQISGEIPKSLDSLPNLRHLNLSNNELNGSVSKSLLTKFGKTSFSGNEALCLNSTNCSSSSTNSNPTYPKTPPENQRNKMSKRTLISLITLISILLLVLSSCAVFLCCCWKTKTDSTNSLAASEGGKRSSHSSHKGFIDNNEGGTGPTRTNGLVFLDDKNQFELEDLLRASAEVLGKGNLGTVYKAVLEGNSGTVAVKRLKDISSFERKEFERCMDLIGKMRHPNIVRLRAYYYAREEKLLVYDYMPNGSLHELLHGNRGPGRVPLDWTTRIGLILGAARGVARAHDDHMGPWAPHGAVKSSNVLLDKDGVARVSDFGLTLFQSPARAVAGLGGYRAPEQAMSNVLTREADVYAFGVLMLEVLTGRAPCGPDGPAADLPGWVRSMVKEEWSAEVFDGELSRYKNIEEELVSVLHVAMACVVGQPDKRPTMREVVRMVEEIRIVEFFDFCSIVISFCVVERN